MRPDARARRPPLAGLLGAAALLAGALLALPVYRGGAARPLVAVAVDASESCLRLRPGGLAAASARIRALAAEHPDADLVVVAFADGARVVFGPDRPGALDAAGLARRAGAVRGPATRVDRALDVLEPLAAGRAYARLVLIGDGTSTGPDPSERLAAWRAQRGPVAVERLPAELPDFALCVDAPARVAAGAAWTVVVRVTAAAEPVRPVAGARVVVELGGARARTFERAVDLDAAARTVAFAVPPGPDGTVTLRARVDAGDPVPENDVDTAVVTVGAARRAGLVARDARPVPEAPPGWTLEAVDPAALRADPAALARWDAVVTVDLDEAELPAAALAAFAESGGGWLAAVGRAALDPGSERWPLDFAPPGGGRDVVFVVDGSGSMAGEPWDELRDALATLVRGAAPDDRGSVRVFTDALGPPVELGDAGDVRARLPDRLPGGPTDVVGALDALARERESAGARRDGLAVLLSDGRDEAGRALDAAVGRELRGRLAAARTRLVPVAVGPRADLARLAHLGTPGEPVAHAERGSELLPLLRRALTDERVRPGPVPLTPGAVDAGEPVAAALADALAGALEPAPELARAEPRPGAAVPIRTADGAPALGWWSRGRGAVAALAFDPRSAGVPLGPLLDALAAGRARPAALARDGGALVLRDAAGRPPVVPARLERLDAGGAADVLLAVPATTVGPHPGDRREAPWPAALDAGGLWRVRLGGGDLLFAPPPRDEHRAPRLAVPGGADPAPTPLRGPRGPHPTAPAALLAGLVLVAAHAWVRWGPRLGRPVKPPAEAGR